MGQGPLLHFTNHPSFRPHPPTRSHDEQWWKDVPYDWANHGLKAMGKRPALFLLFPQEIDHWSVWNGCRGYVAVCEIADDAIEGTDYVIPDDLPEVIVYNLDKVTVLRTDNSRKWL